MSFKTAIVDFFFPPKCVFCRSLAKDGLCPACRASLPYTEEKAVQTEESGLRTAAPLYYEGTVRDSLLRFKFNEKFVYAKTFGYLMAECAAEHFSGEFDLVSFVPVSAKRKRERGYDQAQLLAEAMAAYWDTVAVPTLCKTVDTPRQSGLKKDYERRANVLGVYTAVDPERFSGKRILLVDDIRTTGSTMSEAARTLRLAGAKAVIGLTLAQRRPEKGK